MKNQERSPTEEEIKSASASSIQEEMDRKQVPIVVESSLEKAFEDSVIPFEIAKALG